MTTTPKSTHRITTIGSRRDSINLTICDNCHQDVRTEDGEIVPVYLREDALMHHQQGVCVSPEPSRKMGGPA